MTSQKDWHLRFILILFIMTSISQVLAGITFFGIDTPAQFTGTESAERVNAFETLPGCI